MLLDAPAISAAVDCRAHVSISQSDGEFHCLEAPGYVDGHWYFRLSAGGVMEWRDPLPDPAMFALVEAVFGAIAVAPMPAATLVVDTQAFHDRHTGDKLGFGSSAAVAVSLSAALRAFLALEGDDGRTARTAHERFQDGRGSGVDIATSQHGGLLEYRRAAAKIRRIAWPAGLHYRFLWSGHSAATADRLKRLQGQKQSASLQRLCVHSGELAKAWIAGVVTQILGCYPAYIETLSAFSDEYDLGIFDAGHRALVQSANERGIVYKPCGAGGGDVGIVLAECEHDIDEFLRDALPTAVTVLEVSLDDSGLELAE
ncbi:MAG: hypothetical protein R3192_03235 [Woeseiaceae bacterium]|nr:hypothetical protein [Woeseiaceae bacterium]